MRRYFDFPDNWQTLLVDVKAGSPAALASPERIAKYFKQTGEVREIELPEYLRLTEKYSAYRMASEQGKAGD